MQPNLLSTIWSTHPILLGVHKPDLFYHSSREEFFCKALQPQSWSVALHCTLQKLPSSVASYERKGRWQSTSFPLVSSSQFFSPSFVWPTSQKWQLKTEFYTTDSLSVKLESHWWTRHWSRWSYVIRLYSANGYLIGPGSASDIVFHKSVCRPDVWIHFDYRCSSTKARFEVDRFIPRGGKEDSEKFNDRSGNVNFGILHFNTEMFAV